MKRILLIAAVLFALPLPVAALAAGSDSAPASAPKDPDFEAGRAAIEAKNWKLALDHLGRAAARDAANPDIHNYMGYAYRKSGNLDAAFKSYNEALRLDPKHKGAHEYIGEAYLMAGNPAKAQEHLAQLDKICFFPCSEYRDLKKSLEDYKARK